MTEAAEKYMSDVEQIEEKVGIKIANGDKLPGTKRGVLKLRMKNKHSETKCIKITALIVPALSYNLLSVRKISQKGNAVIFVKNAATIKNKNNFKLICESMGNLYTTKLEIDKETVCCCLLYTSRCV